MATPSRASRLLWLSAQVACLAALVPFAEAAASSAQMHPEAAALNPSWTMDEPGLGTWRPATRAISACSTRSRAASPPPAGPGRGRQDALREVPGVFGDPAPAEAVDAHAGQGREGLHGRVRRGRAQGGHRGQRGGVRQDVVRPEGRVQADPAEPTGPGDVRQGWCEPRREREAKCSGAAASSAGPSATSSSSTRWTRWRRTRTCPPRRRARGRRRSARSCPPGGTGRAPTPASPTPARAPRLKTSRRSFTSPRPASPWRRSSPRARLSACWTSRGASTTRISCGARCSTCCSASRTGTGRTCSSPRRGASWSSTTRGRSARSTPCCSPGGRSSRCTASGTTPCAAGTFPEARRRTARASPATRARPRCGWTTGATRLRASSAPGCLPASSPSCAASTR